MSEQLATMMWQRLPNIPTGVLHDTRDGNDEYFELKETGLELTITTHEGTVITDFWTIEQFFAMYEAVLHNVGCDDAGIDHERTYIGFDD